MGVRTQPSMVEGKNDVVVIYVNSETGCDSLRIVQSVDRLIYISDTDMQKGYRKPITEYTIYIKNYLQILIDLLNLEVKPCLYSSILSISSVSKSTRILLS